MVHARICNTHYGHEFKLGHLRLQQLQRQAIAGQIAQGVTFEHILDQIRDNIDHNLERIHLLTKKDMSNIERAFGLRGSEKHKDDAISVKLWVEEMKEKCNDNPVLLHKPQGEASSDTALHIKDFALGIQTPLQAQMLKRFGPNKIICIDATHGTNAYDFSLLSIMVVDEYGEGYPVGWCISNRMDLTLLIEYFKAMKEKVGSVVPNWIMTDDADQFYSAWFSIFGPGPQKLLCTWHVDRAWRGHLNTIKDRELAQKIYHNLEY